jgi:hypothetical protein
MLSISLQSKSPVLSPCLVNGCHQGPAKSVEVKQRPHCWLSLLSVQRDSPEVPIERAESAYLLWGKQAAAPPPPLLRKSVCKLGSMLSPHSLGDAFPCPPLHFPQSGNSISSSQTSGQQQPAQNRSPGTTQDQTSSPAPVPENTLNTVLAWSISAAEHCARHLKPKHYRCITFLF